MQIEASWLLLNSLLFDVGRRLSEICQLFMSIDGDDEGSAALLCPCLQFVKRHEGCIEQREKERSKVLISADPALVRFLCPYHFSIESESL